MRNEFGTVYLAPFANGMNNRAPERRLPDGAVRNAVNVDFLAPDGFATRPGATKVYTGAALRGGFSCPAGQYFVEQLMLKQFNADNTATDLYSGIIGDTIAYDYLNDIVYVSDNEVALKIENGNVHAWGMAPPATPVVTRVAGVFPEGVYIALYSWVDANGVESAPSPMAYITAPESSGFYFTELPAFTDPQAVALRIYLTTADGKIFYHVADTTAAEYTIAAEQYDDGAVFDLHFTTPPPAGKIIRHYNGRMYVATDGGIVQYSEPFAYDHFSILNNYIAFPDEVDIMEPVENGIFFAYGDKTVFYEGNPEDGFNVRPRLNCGGVFGTGQPLPNGEGVMWQSQWGAVEGSPQGQIQQKQHSNVAPDTATAGAAIVRQHEGSKHFIASLSGTTMPTIAASSWMDAEIIRRG